MGPSVYLTVFCSASVFMSTMQHVLLFFSTAMTASLSLGFMLAFSRRSFGRTICPFWSIVTTASILQHSLMVVFAMYFTAKATMREYLTFYEKSEKSEK